jgi:hypothetical protein
MGKAEPDAVGIGLRFTDTRQGEESTRGKLAYESSEVRCVSGRAQSARSVQEGQSV